MKYSQFQFGVLGLMGEAGDNSRVRFDRDKDKGLFIARTGSGVTITMPENGNKITVRWGSGHTAVKPVVEAFGA